MTTEESAYLSRIQALEVQMGVLMAAGQGLIETLDDMRTADFDNGHHNGAVQRLRREIAKAKADQP